MNSQVQDESPRGAGALRSAPCTLPISKGPRLSDGRLNAMIFSPVAPLGRSFALRMNARAERPAKMLPSHQSLRALIKFCSFFGKPSTFRNRRRIVRSHRPHLLGTIGRERGVDPRKAAKAHLPSDGVR